MSLDGESSKRKTIVFCTILSELAEMDTTLGIDTKTLATSINGPQSE